jgi:hypothetical protein
MTGSMASFKRQLLGSLDSKHYSGEQSKSQIAETRKHLLRQLKRDCLDVTENVNGLSGLELGPLSAFAFGVHSDSE